MSNQSREALHGIHSFIHSLKSFPSLKPGLLTSFVNLKGGASPSKAGAIARVFLFSLRLQASLGSGKIKKPTLSCGLLMVVGKTGFEPATLWSQTRCATGLRYFPMGATPVGLEPTTYCLEGSCSIQLSYGVLLGLQS